MPGVLMAGDLSAESTFRGVAVNSGCSRLSGMKTVDCPVTYRAPARRLFAVLAALLLLTPAPARAEIYGHAIAQPYFDFPSWARFSGCRPGSLPWGYEVFPDYFACDGGCQGCPPESVSCLGDFVVHRPNDWYGSADFVPLTIDYAQDIEAARVGPLGPTALSTSDLGPEFDAGGKFTFGRRLGCYRVEGTYLGNYEWADAAVVTGAGDLSSLLSGFANPVDPLLDNNDLVQIANQSRMQSYEANVRYWIEMPPGPFDVSLLVGARYMQIVEQFNFRSESAAAINAVEVDTDNDMWGVQIGIAGDWLIHPRFWINLDLKGAMFDNQASQNTSYTIDAAAPIPTAAAQDRTSWLFDLSLVGHWQMTPTMVFNIGYQATWVEGVAIAYENLQTDNTLLVNGPGVLDDRGRLVYHGPVIGLTWMR
jgi:hypothetical protein